MLGHHRAIGVWRAIPSGRTLKSIVMITQASALPPHSASPPSDSWMPLKSMQTKVEWPIVRRFNPLGSRCMTRCAVSFLLGVVQMETTQSCKSFEQLDHAYDLPVYRYRLVRTDVQKSNSQWLSEYHTLRSIEPQSPWPYTSSQPPI